MLRAGCPQKPRGRLRRNYRRAGHPAFAVQNRPIRNCCAEQYCVNPDFCLAGEAIQDRLIPYIDVYYRAAGGFSISPLRYAFPEWTACQHVGAPCDFNGVNAAVMLGAVICVEPECYQASLADPVYEELAKYIQATERIRGDLRHHLPRRLPRYAWCGGLRGQRRSQGGRGNARRLVEQGASHPERNRVLPARSDGLAALPRTRG